jgi:hypothetical protein
MRELPCWDVHDCRGGPDRKEEEEGCFLESVRIVIK